MTHLLYLISVLLSGHAQVVEFDQPTGDLHHGDILVEYSVPSMSICDDRGGISMHIDGVLWCIGEDF